jgi:predicted enzyme related to lactoylglutathione lyase
MTNPVGWFEIYVDDIDRAKAFYETVFRVKLDKLGTEGIEMWQFPSDAGSHGTSGTIACVDGMPAGGNSTVVYFQCGDCAVEEARIEAAGDTVVRPKMSIGQYGFVTIANDTEGNLIGLHSLA